MVKEDSSKKFILEFFKGAKIKDESGVLTISEVDPNLESFIGEKAPYKFVFDINLHNKVPNSELIMQGSYFLAAIRDYLRNMGQTSLTKINIPLDLKKIEKDKALKNYKILEIKEENPEFIYEFSFLSVYQYLNDKKQAMNKIVIKKNENLDLDLSKFKTSKGNKEEISSLDPLDQYNFAKKILERKIGLESKPIKESLKVKLENELERIRSHYFKQIKEKDEEVETCLNKIKMLQGKLRHTTYWRDIGILERNIKESKERLEMLKKRSYRERLLVEENFHITDEVEKHALSIKNVLIHLAILYYPVYSLQVSNKGKKSIIKYDPVLEKIV